MPFPALLLLTLLLLICGCATGQDYDTGENAYFFGVFGDIPLPREMNTCMETSASESGKLKTGMQAFRGRVEADSLVRTLRNYLGQTGWIARGLAQGANSFLLLFQKANRYVALHITDAALTTELRIYVSAEAPFHPAPPLVINLNPAEE